MNRDPDCSHCGAGKDGRCFCSKACTVEYVMGLPLSDPAWGQVRLPGTVGVAPGVAGAVTVSAGGLVDAPLLVDAPPERQIG